MTRAPVPCRGILWYTFTNEIGLFKHEKFNSSNEFAKKGAFLRTKSNFLHLGVWLPVLPTAHAPRSTD